MIDDHICRVNCVLIVEIVDFCITVRKIRMLFLDHMFECRLNDMVLRSCSTPMTLSNSIPAELAGAIPLIEKFQVGLVLC